LDGDEVVEQLGIWRRPIAQELAHYRFMFRFDGKIWSQRLVIVAALDDPLGANTEQSVIWLSFDIPNYTDQTDVEGLERFIVQCQVV